MDSDPFIDFDSIGDDDLRSQQRSAQHFSVYDLLDFRTTNAKAQIAALEWFMMNGCHPASLTHEEWGAILTQIIDGFQAVIDIDSPTGPSSEAYDMHQLECQVRFQVGMDLYVKWYWDLWR